MSQSWSIYALNVKGSGASFPAPLYSQWSSSFSALNAEYSESIMVSYTASNSRSGVMQFKKNDSDIQFAASDVVWTDIDTSDFFIVPAIAGVEFQPLIES
ncbi:hypothetical protein HK096_007145 [Nowakowskiella sp. JEL0078]|nr:hypothetical protein HK096_007145 [Nowakowskiella sp. JEL0078]